MLKQKQAEKIHGPIWSVKKLSTILDERDIIHSHHVIFNLIQHGIVDDFFLIDGKDFSYNNPTNNSSYFFKGKKLEEFITFYESLCNQYRELKKNKTLYADVGLARLIGSTVDDLEMEVKTGLWDDSFAEVAYNPNGRKCFFFDKQALLKRRYQPLSVVSKILNVSMDALIRYQTNGDITQPDRLKGTKLFDLEEIREKLPLIRESYFQNAVQSVSAEYTCWELLSTEFQNLIRDYLVFRLNVEELASLDGHIYPKIDRKYADTSREILALLFVKLIKEKCGIISIKGRKVCDMSENEMDQFNPAVFNIENLTQNDVIKVFDGLSDSTKGHYGGHLRPFLSWYFEKVDEESDEDDGRVRKLRKRIKSVLKVVPHRYRRRKFNTTKVFLTRKQIVQMYHTLRKNPNGNQHTNMRNSVLWMFGAFLGIRPEEMLEVTISDFVLDSSGYIATNQSGYGEFRLPEEKSKGKYSPSHEDVGHLVVPRLVELLNWYIGQLYRYQNYVGDGFLFRKHIADPKSKLKIPPKFLSLYRDLFEFVDKDKRDFLEIKTARRSMNEIIRNETIVNQKLNKKILRAAEIHMRHDVFKAGGKTNDIYTQEILPKDYYLIIDAALNFPWDIHELTQWEIENGYDDNEQEEEKKINGKTFDSKRTTANNIDAEHNLTEIENQAILLQEELKKLNERQKKMEYKVFLQQRKKLNDQLLKLERKLKNGERV
ncbi:hypothetical protein [Peribacillus deserti]|uniref:Uncharacterized protein n=1 Tax=Peribacillus deserti TaxID=673318 RepID=A0A2N5M4H5_9BACI|nr:hypothetical protein [Peribacillus deserti]PLT29264.1 hypothetical protein CUU66_13925 [Peribacillus deserti]